MTEVLAREANLGSSLRMDTFGADLRPDRRQTSIQLWGDRYGEINLARVRRALDAITLDDVTAVAVGFTKFGFRPGYQIESSLLFSMSSDGIRVKIKAPCGEIRRYKVSTLDRILTRLGF